ncbi:DNA alkylation repair protein [Paenibacillus sp. N4]|uniref:DNA alkylation repair protein n=1 Tax=Paenibacillus vietnamensis TaxID=2590547 RepID=UPI001CD117E4|nr:DNA alkylation repair protein [Paenibacillus vietnamensis]MCA0756419.1 DNA alkylation repair protein [Paenibacillus vietnamensis]
MAEPLKAIYDGHFIESFAALVKSAWSSFDEAAFAAGVRAGDWEQLELKARMRRITETLGAELPDSYEEALRILYRIDEKCTGLPYLFFPDFVEVYGRQAEHWELSMAALSRFTVRSTSEFAVRPFILEDQERMAAQMLEWAGHDNEHVRRLASEGMRPRLPWAQALPMFKKDPSPIFPILEKLKRDPSLYVRKSVANNLNDIAKDHPGLIADLAYSWRGEDERTDWIVRHGCRTLIKKNDPRIMALFGYAGPSGEEGDEQSLAASAELKAVPEAVPIGGEAKLRYRIRLREGERVKLRIEYGVDFVKSGGKTSLKRFLLSDREYEGGSVFEGERVHRFADLTTRKHYAGPHRLSLWVNGREAASSMLEVTETPAGAAAGFEEPAGAAVQMTGADRS